MLLLRQYTEFNDYIYANDRKLVRALADEEVEKADERMLIESLAVKMTLIKLGPQCNLYCLVM